MKFNEVELTVAIVDDFQGTPVKTLKFNPLANQDEDASFVQKIVSIPTPLF